MHSRFFFQSLIFLFASLASMLALHAQPGMIDNPTTLSIEPEKKKVQVGEELDIMLEIDIQDPWYVYSLNFSCDGGAQPAVWNFEEHSSYALVGKAKAIQPKEVYDEVFECDIKKHTQKATFRQRIKVLGQNLQISGDYQYMTCNTNTGVCLPPFSDSFRLDEFEVRPAKKVATEAITDPKDNQKPTLKPGERIQPDSLKEPKNSGLPKDSADTSSLHTVGANKDKDEPSNKEKTEQLPEDLKELKTNKKEEVNQSLWWFFLAAFGSGLVALITPCVFPMIPMTVSFFTRKGVKREKPDGTLKSEQQVLREEKAQRRKGIRDALLFGLFIVGIYTLIGTLVSALFGDSVANFIATHWIPNVLFFLVFVAFGLAFLGLFEITLPSSWSTAADRQADKGGLYGVFFIALALVVVSFSCTGPIVGSVLILSADGEFLKPAVGMFGFSLALAIPFVLFALFPNSMNKLPKSGGWLNAVKVVLGFLELALALKFLSIPDQAYHWGLLDRDVYLALWIVIFTLLGMYLLGLFRTKHDSPMDYVPVPRIILSIITFSFVVYMLPGMIGAPLPGLSGYLPPQHTLTFDLNQGGQYAAQPTSDVLCEEPRFGDRLEMAHGLKGYFDYEQALRCAKNNDKPLFVDFTGHACVNCREMEARVFTKPEVRKKLQQDFILVSLYVDDKLELPKEEWYTSPRDGKVKKTIGKQNADLQVTAFQSNGQPYYYIVDPHGQEKLIEPRAYDLDAKAFADWLEKGRNAYALKH